MDTAFFSIIIPTYNRPQELSQCLAAITELNYPIDRYEVIVVDDGSDLPLDSVVSPFYHQIKLTLLRQNNAGPATARNFGAKLARGDFLAFTDDDCRPAFDWLQKLAQSLKTNPHSLIGGQVVNALSTNPFSTTSQLLLEYLYTYYHNPSRQNNRFFSIKQYSDWQNRIPDFRWF